MVTYENILVTKELDKHLLDQLERLLVVIDLCHKEVPLKLFNEFGLGDLLTSAKVVDKPLVLLLPEWHALDLFDHELGPSC